MLPRVQLTVVVGQGLDNRSHVVVVRVRRTRCPMKIKTTIVCQYYSAAGDTYRKVPWYVVTPASDNDDAGGRGKGCVDPVANSNGR